MATTGGSGEEQEVCHPPAYARLEINSLPEVTPAPPDSSQQSQPAHQFTIVTPDKPIESHLHNYLGLAIITSIFCNILVGLCAVVCSVQSIRSARAGDIDKARLYASISLRLSITAVIVGVITILLISYLLIF